MKVTAKVPEHVFEWPLSNTVPKEEKIRVVCQVPKNDDLIVAQRSFTEEVTNEINNTTRFEVNAKNYGAIYDLCVLRIEGCEDEVTGNPIKPETAKGNLHHYVRSNFGLDEDVHGCFQIEFGEWFNLKIRRIRADAKKNVTVSPTPSTGSTPSSETGATLPTSAPSPSTPDDTPK